jgi:hypothetical protein
MINAMVGPRPILHAIIPDDDEDEDGTEDTYERFVRFSS